MKWAMGLSDWSASCMFLRRGTMRIIENRAMLCPQPTISILCITFNQIDYIRDAINSFLTQEIDEAIEILINDDCSTDGTTDVLLEYQRQHPEFFRIVTHEENQFSRGASPMGEFLVPLARGEYIAMCEGDDYWTDVDKLKKQLGVMRRNPEIAACVHANENVQASTKRRLSVVRYSDHDTMISAEDVITHSQCYATNSLFVRSDAMSAYRSSPFGSLKTDGDHKMLVFFGLLSGGIYYLNEVMSAYRVLAKNSVNRSMLMGDALVKTAASKREKRLALLDLVDSYTDGAMHKLVQRGKDAMDYAFYRDTRNLRILKSRWPERLKKEGLLSHIDLYLYAYCRPLHKVLMGIYCKL